MPNLIALPYEVLANIVASLDFDDVFNLASTCSQMKYLITEESICKSILQSKIPYSNEVREAHAAGTGNTAALRRVAKRRHALAHARPFTVATVGFADSYIYMNGYLCYTLDDKVRILDLHRAAHDEIVFSIPALLIQTLADVGGNEKGSFRVLYYADGCLSCVYRSSETESSAWLISFDISPGVPRRKRILIVHELDSTDHIFVRNNKECLYYGTHSERGTDGYKKWVIRGFNLKTRQEFEHRIHFPDLVGSDIGSTICFEIYGGYFYGLSNQTSFEVEEIDWTSFYHGVRFPLESPHQDLVEKTDNHKMWRRQHKEGPIDDRWTSIRLDLDESTGELNIVESRKEWYMGNSRSQRTYYTTKLDFSKSTPEHKLTESLSVKAASINLTASIVSSSSATAQSITTTTSSTAQTSPPKHDLSLLPSDPLIKLLRDDDHPHHMHSPPPRLAHTTHPSTTTHTIAQSRVRSYHTSCSTHLDLVDDPLPSDWQRKQRLHLRVGSRKPKPPLRDATTGLLRKPASDIATALDELYSERGIFQFPDCDREEGGGANAEVLYGLMNPPSHLGEVQGVMDGRSLVYGTGGGRGPQAMVFVGFDPGVRLEGVKRWPGLGSSEKGVGEGPHVDGRAAGVVGCEGEVEKRIMGVEKMVGAGRKGKGKGRAMDDIDVGRDLVCSGAERGWIWKEKAMYMTIGLGFHFCL